MRMKAEGGLGTTRNGLIFIGMTTTAHRSFEDMPAQVGWPDAPAGNALLDATLAPSRSLPNLGFWALMVTIVGVSVSAGAYFASMGAWPVLGFFGLDVVLVWLAFRLSYRQGRLRERVHVSAEQVTVVREHPGGHVQHWVLSPFWARLHVDDPEEHHVRLRVVSHGKTLILGAFLPPEERVDFAASLVRALNRARDARFDGEGDVVSAG